MITLTLLPAIWMLLGAAFVVALWRLLRGPNLPDRVLAHLKLLDGDYGGFPIDRYTHCLQAATRALRDGR